MLPTIFNSIDKAMNDSDEIRRWVHQKYGMSLILRRLYSVKKSTYLAVTDDIQLNQQNNEWEWWSMKVSISKIWNELNPTKIAFIRKTNALTSLLPTMFDWKDETMKLITCNAQTVTLIIDFIIMHFSINM